MTKPIIPHANKSQLRDVMDDLFNELGIDVPPIAAEELQERMKKLALESNELSRDLIAAREEIG